MRLEIDMTNAHLLLVDSDPHSLQTLVGYFQSETGITFHTADNPQEAWAVLQDRTEQFDRMILDCLMPERAAAGAYHYLTMPARRDAVLSIVHAALTKSSFRNALRRQLRNQPGKHRQLDTCEFSIRTLEEAGELATLIAQACPNADAALFGISELLVNGVEHGNLGLSYEEKSQLALDNRWKSEVDRRSALPDNLGKRVRLSFRREPERITLRIADEGRGFTWRNYLELDPDRACYPNGRGIALARMLSFSSIHYEGCGNVAVATIAPSSN
jgi:CheY-like chemotaxis protein